MRSRIERNTSPTLYEGTEVTRKKSLKGFVEGLTDAVC